MKLTFKDNNFYYYHYKIFNGELSFKLFILLIIILYFNKSFIKYNVWSIGYSYYSNEDVLKI